MKALRIDLRTGETASLDDGRILVTLEEKSGQRARLRFEADTNVKIERVRPVHNVRAKGLTQTE